MRKVHPVDNDSGGQIAGVNPEEGLAADWRSCLAADWFSEYPGSVFCSKLSVDLELDPYRELAVAGQCPLG